MRKYSLSVRAAALLCAVCLLLTGCGQVASPDDSGDSGDSGAPAPTAEPAAEETPSALEKLGLTDAGMKAAQLAAKHLGQDAVLTDVVEFSSDDFGPVTYHVLLLKDAKKNYLAYRYGTGSVYCFPEETVQNFNKNFMDSEEVVCTYLLRSLFRYTANYLHDWETVTKLTQSEVEEVNQAMARGENPAGAAEIVKAAQDERKAAQEAAQAAQEKEKAAQAAQGKAARLAAIEAQAASLTDAEMQAALLAIEYLEYDVALTDVVEFSLDDFEGKPCHVLLLRNAHDCYLAYSYDTETVYCPSSKEMWNYRGDLSTEKDRCIYLLCALSNASRGYVNREETLTRVEVAQINSVLSPEKSAADIMEEVNAAQDALLKEAQLAAAEVEVKATQIAMEQLGKDAVLTDVVKFSMDDFEGVPFRFLMLRSTKDEFVAYSYDTETVYSPRAEDVIWYNGENDWSTEEGRCAYLLWVFACHTGVYWSSEETRTELTAAEVAKVNQALALGLVPAATEEVTTTLPADVALPKGSGAYKVLSECPEEFSRRELSDEEIQSLAQGDLERARERISTGGDFAAWLVAMGGRLRSGLARTGDEQRVIGAPFAYDRVHEMLDSTMAAALAVRVLGDDLSGISIVAAQATTMGGTFLCGNLIPADGGYYLISFDALTDEWKDAVEAGQITPEAFPAIWADGTAGITAWCRSTDNPRGNVLVQAFYFPGEQEIVLDHEGELYIPQDPWKGQEFFRDEALAEELVKQKAAHIKPENIGHYDLSTKLGGTTLTPEEAYALLDMEPEQVKERVKTAADVLMLMLAGQYSDCHGDRNITIDGNIWHYNLNAFQVMETRTTNCGSAANLANYLLEGDYEEIGFILHAYYIGDGGGHVYNYFKYQGKYYIVDFSWYMFANYQPGNDFPVMELDRLEDYGSRISELYVGVCMAFAHTSPGQHYPNVFDVENAIYAIPEGVEYTLLYQATSNGAYTLKEYPLDKSQLDWTTFGEP